MKFFLATTLLIGVLIQVQGLPSPADARIREQFDREHEEGIDRIRARLRGLTAAEAGKRDRQIIARDSEAEVLVANVPSRRGGGGGGPRREPEDGDRLVDRQGDQDEMGGDGGDGRQMANSEGQGPQGQDGGQDGGQGQGMGGGEQGGAQPGGGAGSRGRIPIVYARGSDKKVRKLLRNY